MLNKDLQKSSDFSRLRGLPGKRKNRLFLALSPVLGRKICQDGQKKFFFEKIDFWAGPRKFQKYVKNRSKYAKNRSQVSLKWPKMSKSTQISRKKSPGTYFTGDKPKKSDFFVFRVAPLRTYPFWGVLGWGMVRPLFFAKKPRDKA